MPENLVYAGPVANASMGTSGAGVTAPTAGQALATILPPAGKGIYAIKVSAYLSAGTPAAADNANIEFRFGGTTLSRIPLFPALNLLSTWETTFTSDAATNFTVNATANATGGVIYNVFMTATKLRDTF